MYTCALWFVGFNMTVFISHLLDLVTSQSCHCNMLRVKRLIYVLLVVVLNVFVVAFYYTNGKSTKPSEEDVSPLER